MTNFSTQLLTWYDQNKRSLPWRDHPDAYAVWVSEIMLQQTRVETVIPYFARWLERLPTVQALASASEQDVLTLWEGLGYYSRARSLGRAAQVVVYELGGEMPRDAASLRRLPGIGRYTAAAIASMAFGEDIATLDGNIRRVLARYFDLTIPADGSEGEARLWQLAEQNLPAGRAGDYNQAIMDLGAGICLPRAPLCLFCPLAHGCAARAAGVQDARPILKPKPPVPHKAFSAAVIVQDGRVLLEKRPARGLLGGMWQFPNVEMTLADAPLSADVETAFETATRLRVRVLRQVGVFSHAYTHFKVTVWAWECSLISQKEAEMHWVSLSELENYPMGKVDRLVARTLMPA
jgi:A/G-specific adenine glycosylase